MYVLCGVNSLPISDSKFSSGSLRLFVTTTKAIAIIPEVGIEY